MRYEVGPPQLKYVPVMSKKWVCARCAARMIEMTPTITLAWRRYCKAKKIPLLPRVWI